VLFDLVREINRVRAGDEAAAAGLGAELRYLGGVLGVLQDDPDVYLRGGGSQEGLSDADIDELIRQRIDARESKNWAEADHIRDELQAAGILLEDGAAGTTWRRA
jgi:cysteinyl-tRNA synthetase